MENFRFDGGFRTLDGGGVNCDFLDIEALNRHEGYEEGFLMEDRQ